MRCNVSKQSHVFDLAIVHQLRQIVVTTSSEHRRNVVGRELCKERRIYGIRDFQDD